MKSMRLKKLCLCAFFSSLTVVCSWLCIYLPSGVPITLQVFAVALSGYTLGVFLGPLSVFVYILLGVVGIPVFAGFSSGIGYLLGPTGGYIFGFLFLSLFCAIAARFKKISLNILFSLIGIIFAHLIGILHYYYIADFSVSNAFLFLSAPYIPKDIICVLGAFILSLRLKKVLNFKF